MQTTVRKYTFETGARLYSDRLADGTKGARWTPPGAPSHVSFPEDRDKIARGLRAARSLGLKFSRSAWVAG